MKKTIDLSLINIWEDETAYYGADQHWFKSRLHGMSGCGPTTSAMITMYMAEAFPSCSKLYDYHFPVRKEEFVAHMAQVRDCKARGYGTYRRRILRFKHRGICA